MIAKTFKNWRIPYSIAGAILALASLVPETALSMLCGWLFALVLTASVTRSKHVGAGLFYCGMVFHLIAFYWVPQTLEFFGGFPYIVSCALFFAFSVLSSLQFLLTGWLYSILRRTALQKLGVALAFAWIATDFLFPRLFPWSLSHSQIYWKGFASLAEYVGVYPLSGLLFIMAHYVLCFVIPHIVAPHASNRQQRAFAVICLMSICLLGEFRFQSFNQQLAGKVGLRVGVIQGNLDAEKKGDMRYFTTNVDRYQTLTKAVEQRGAQLVIWPEVIMNHWMPEQIDRVSGTKFDPHPEASAPLLYGSLSFRRDPSSSNTLSRFNSAVGRDTNGKVTGIYHKKVLMPLGEYLPFEETFPVLRRLSPNTGDFSRGDLDHPIVLPIAAKKNGMLENAKAVKLGVLICYEDLIPRLARQSVVNGAEILVNLTNDAWYGDTAAPTQHHLLALWRAIETRRYLVRATNTGYTAVVDPLGYTTASLDTFTAGSLLVDVVPLTGQTLYLRWGDWFSWSALAIVVLFALIGLGRGGERAASRPKVTLSNPR